MDIDLIKFKPNEMSNDFHVPKRFQKVIEWIT